MVLGFGKKEPEVVGCYGKLPLHGDYVSYQCDGKGASRLTSWLDEGYRITGGRDELLACETRFVIPGRGRQVMFGAMWPSGDSSGTRRFPFSLFAGVAAKKLTYLESNIPLAVAPVWEQMASAVPDLKEAGTLDAIQARVSAICLPDFPDQHAVAAEFAARAAESAVAPECLAVLLDLLRLTRAIAPGGRGDIPAFALRMPMLTGCDPALEVSLWLAILAKGLGENAVPGQSHLFIRPSREGVPGEVFIFHRDLKPEDLGFILAPTEAYPYANLLKAPEDDQGLASFREWCAEHLGENPTVTAVAKADYSGAF